MVQFAIQCLGLVLLFMPMVTDAEPLATSSWPDVPRFAKQVMISRNNQGLPFLVIDKVQATVWVFSERGALLGTSVVLVGLAMGDMSVPGIGERPLSSISQAERITPAGRFASTLGRNLLGQEVLWVDYDNAVSLHRAIHGQPSEHRAERMASPTPLDNRVTYGCINVPARFFNNVVLPTVRPKGSIVYVLPERQRLAQIFKFLPPVHVR